MCVCVCVRACVRAGVRECVRACVRECMSECLGHHRDKRDISVTGWLIFFDRANGHLPYQHVCRTETV